MPRLHRTNDGTLAVRSFPLFHVLVLLATLLSPSAGARAADDAATTATKESLRRMVSRTFADDARFETRRGRLIPPERRIVLRGFVDVVLADSVGVGLMRPEAPAADRAPVIDEDRIRNVYLRRLLQAIRELDDDDLDAFIDEIPAELVDGVCADPAKPRVGGAPDVEASTRFVETLTRGWDALNRGEAPRQPDDDALAAALGRFADASGSGDTAMDVIVADDRASVCAGLTALAPVVRQAPKAERVAVYRLLAIGVSTMFEARDRGEPPNRERVLQSPRRSFRFADGTVDLDDDRSIASALGLPLASPLLTPASRLANAVARNALLGPMLERAADDPQPATLAQVLRDVTFAVPILAPYGLLRVDTTTLLRMQPLLMKVAAAQTAGDCGSFIGALRFPFDGLALSIDERAVALDGFARAIDAINRGDPVRPDSDDAVYLASLVAAGTMASDEAQLLADARGAAAGCPYIRALFKFELAVPAPVGTPLTRQYLTGLTGVFDRRVPAEVGEVPQTPIWGKLVNARGEQLVEITVDPTGHVVSTRIVSATFVPASIAMPDGTTIATADLYEREVRAWMTGRTYPPKLTDGRPRETVIQIPFIWKMDP